MLKPNLSFEAFCRMSKKGNLVPIYAMFLADTQTPVSAFMKIQAASKTGYSFLLESVEGQEKWASFSFLGFDPAYVCSFRGQQWQMQQGKRVLRKQLKGSPFVELKKILGKFKPVQVTGVPRFFGGAVGFLGYETVRFFEKISLKKPHGMDVPDGVFMITDSLIVFDNVRHQIQIIVNAHIPASRSQKALRKIYDRALKHIEEIHQVLIQPLPNVSSGRNQFSAPRAVLGEKAFIDRVKKAKAYIAAGDLIQVVLSNRYSGETKLEPLHIYRALRRINPSPYMFFLNLKTFALIGSSPETLVRLEEGMIHVRPIAGTRPRGRNEKEDAMLAAQLLADPKERAEHIMLVDLGRNDVGKVAAAASVQVTELMKVERYSHVMHLVSHVQGKIRPDLDAFDVMAATFPAGTLSGAAKVRAMQVIEELEPQGRGFYGGAVGYFSFSGNMDLCITIRTMLLKQGTYVLQAGAGIVADSDPKLEFQECENKARAVIKALHLAKEIG